MHSPNIVGNICFVRVLNKNWLCYQTVGTATCIYLFLRPIFVIFIPSLFKNRRIQSASKLHSSDHHVTQIARPLHKIAYLDHHVCHGLIGLHLNFELNQTLTIYVNSFRHSGIRPKSKTVFSGDCPSKHKTLKQCCINVGPPSTTLDQN